MERGLRAELMGEVDEVWSEVLRHLPLVEGRKDPERAAVEFMGLLRTGARDAQSMGAGRADTLRTRVTAQGGQLRIDRLAHAALILRKGDKILALEREGQPMFEVLSVDDRAHLRLICELGDAN